MLLIVPQQNYVKSQEQNIISYNLHFPLPGVATGAGAPIGAGLGPGAAGGTGLGGGGLGGTGLGVGGAGGQYSAKAAKHGK